MSDTNEPAVWRGRDGYESQADGTVNSGETFTPTDSEINGFGDLMDEVPEGRATDDGDGGEESGGDDTDDTDDGGGETPLEDLTHEELKERAKAAGIAEDVDLRREDDLLAALREQQAND